VFVCTDDGKKSDDIYLNLVMEYIPETVYKTLKSHSQARKLLPLCYVQVYMFQIVRALGYIHRRGICHRDIKPQVSE
jgi:glycogen synthase kinase 3 beta